MFSVKWSYTHLFSTHDIRQGGGIPQLLLLLRVLCFSHTNRYIMPQCGHTDYDYLGFSSVCDFTLLSKSIIWSHPDSIIMKRYMNTMTSVTGTSALSEISKCSVQYQK